jgi:AcrR family transcriptional regulator
VGRRRGYSVDAVVDAAKDAFWRLGYDGASVTDLEAATGLSRSSLYQAFGSKQRLFADALDAYIRGFIDPLLDPLESPAAGSSSVESFVRQLARVLREDGLARRYGCLWANSIAGLGRNAVDRVDVRGAEYWDRLRKAYLVGLQRAAPLEREGLTPPEERAQVLSGATFACWLLVPVDIARALDVCDGMLAQVASWQWNGAVAGQRVASDSAAWRAPQ